MDTSCAFSKAEALRAVRNRCGEYDGKLFYAVVTTGIYCLPSCSSRQAKEENLRFFDSAQLAMDAGFRACKRCKPDNVTSYNMVIDVARYIEAHADTKLTLSMLAGKFKTSPTHLQKKFNQAFGLSPKVFQDGIRQQKFKSLLRDGESVTDAVLAAGYGSSSRVYENTSDQLGMAPSVYKAGAKGEQISFACSETTFGYLLLAATDKGVCFAMLGDCENGLHQNLKNEFPNASIKRSKDDTQITVWFQEIEQYLNAKKALPDIPLDLRGTTFQMRVWQFLTSIERGCVVSYREVAEGIKQPTAFRAAATACAKNRIALLIPCHRVLRGDGAMGGYRWGVELKQKLLTLEKTDLK